MHGSSSKHAPILAFSLCVSTSILAGALVLWFNAQNFHTQNIEVDIKAKARASTHVTLAHGALPRLHAQKSTIQSSSRHRDALSSSNGTQSSTQEREQRIAQLTGEDMYDVIRLPKPAKTIYPLLRRVDHRCGTWNLCMPGILKHNGTGKVFIDVGVQDGLETINAVNNGFLTFSFDPALKKDFVDRIPRAIRSNFSFVECQKDSTGKWKLPQLQRPRTEGGFGYIFPFRLSDKDSDTCTEMTLDTVLPRWVEEVYFFKIDTDGYDIQVLKGAKASLARRRFRFIQFEFMPWNIRRFQLGDPMTLLNMLPSSGGLCFDIMGAHNPISRPSTPLKTYFQHLDAGVRDYKEDDLFGPWEDILCHIPAKPTIWTSKALHQGFDFMIHSVCPSTAWNTLIKPEPDWCRSGRQRPMD